APSCFARTIPGRALCALTFFRDHSYIAPSKTSIGSQEKPCRRPDAPAISARRQRSWQKGRKREWEKGRRGEGETGSLSPYLPFSRSPPGPAWSRSPRALLMRGGQPRRGAPSTCRARCEAVGCG